MIELKVKAVYMPRDAADLLRRCNISTPSKQLPALSKS